MLFEGFSGRLERTEGQFLFFRFRQVEHFAVRQNDGAFDDVLQFADIARPAVVDQPLHVLLGYAADIFAELALEQLQKVQRQKRNILGALPQRRDVDRKHIEPVV